MKSNSAEKKEYQKGKLHCKKCNADGDSIETCFELIGYPKWYKGSKSREGNTRLNLTASS